MGIFLLLSSISLEFSSNSRAEVARCMSGHKAGLLSFEYHVLLQFASVCTPAKIRVRKFYSGNSEVIVNRCYTCSVSSATPNIAMLSIKPTRITVPYTQPLTTLLHIKTNIIPLCRHLTQHYWQWLLHLRSRTEFLSSQDELHSSFHLLILNCIQL